MNSVKLFEVTQNVRQALQPFDAIELNRSTSYSKFFGFAPTLGLSSIISSHIL